MKKFKTFEEQLELIRSRNIIVDNEEEVLNFLSFENYYKIINGYKDLFLEPRGRKEDRYQVDTYFEDIKNLYLFDRKLSNVIFESALVFENNFKTQVAYVFSNNHSEEYAYFNPNNFAQSEHRAVLKLISTLAGTISNESNNGIIQHYIHNYSSIPLWVLVGSLTFGNVIKFFNVMKVSEQNSVAKFFATHYQINNEDSPIKNEIKEFISIAQYVNDIRNLCAHDRRIFNSRHSLKKSELFKRYTLLEFNDRNVNIIAIFVIFKAFLAKESYQKFYQNIDLLFEEYRGKFKSITFDKILNEMGIKNEEILKQLAPK